jgi:ribosome-associated translation inhibitor RaiA
MATPRKEPSVFPASVPRPTKRRAGATDADLTPLAIRTTRLPLDPDTRRHIQRRSTRQLRKFAPLIERVTVRFEDVRARRGGVDQVCRIKVVLSTRPSVVVQERAATPREAFDAAIGATVRTVRRVMGRAEMSARARGRQSAAPDPDLASPSAASAHTPPNPPPEAGSVIGRRVGSGATNLADAAARPEKLRRDALVDTSQRGVSETDRKAGGGSTARRNAKRNLAGLTSALEDSAQSRPSRKSTRKSAGRARRDSNLELRELAALHSPSERARRNLATSKRK